VKKHQLLTVEVKKELVSQYQMMVSGFFQVWLFWSQRPLNLPTAAVEVGYLECFCKVEETFVVNNTLG
jgi:hypothetical protein